MKTPVHAQIESLHALYRRLSKMEVGLRFDRESSWMEFIRAGFTEKDLEAVIDRIHMLIKTGDRRIEALRFSNLIQGLDRFEEELALVRAEAQGLVNTERHVTINDLKTVLKAKQEAADELSDMYAYQNAFGFVWQNSVARENYRRLQGEIKGIKERIASAV